MRSAREVRDFPLGHRLPAFRRLLSLPNLFGEVRPLSCGFAQLSVSGRSGACSPPVESYLIAPSVLATREKLTRFPIRGLSLVPDGRHLCHTPSLDTVPTLHCEGRRRLMPRAGSVPQRIHAE